MEAVDLGEGVQGPVQQFVGIDLGDAEGCTRCDGQDPPIVRQGGARRSGHDQFRMRYRARDAEWLQEIRIEFGHRSGARNVRQSMMQQDLSSVFASADAVWNACTPDGKGRGPGVRKDQGEIGFGSAEDLCVRFRLGQGEETVDGIEPFQQGRIMRIAGCDDACLRPRGLQCPQQGRGHHHITQRVGQADEHDGWGGGGRHASLGYGRMAQAESPFVQDPDSEQEPFAGDLTVAVIGARRVRQGTGPYLALQADRAGAKVAGVLGTRPTSVRKAVEWLEERGLRTAAFVDHETMLEELRPDVVIVASPMGTHRAWIHAALDVQAHVYCEKPLIAAPAAIALEALERSAAANLVLAENCQWPYVLPALTALHPKADLSTASRFRMLMAPPMRGLARWHEVLSHPLSLIQAAVPGPADLDDVVFEESSPDAVDSRLRFTYRTIDRELACEVVLEDMEVYPRPAEFAFDDALCRRVVDASDYSISFVDGTESCTPITLLDPMESCLRAFLRRVMHARTTHSAPLDEDLVRRQFLLEHLLEAYRESVRS